MRGSRSLFSPICAASRSKLDAVRGAVAPALEERRLEHIGEAEHLDEPQAVRTLAAAAAFFLRPSRLVPLRLARRAGHLLSAARLLPVDGSALPKPPVPCLAPICSHASQT